MKSGKWLTMAVAFSSAMVSGGREFNEAYEGENLNRVAFPIGGIGAGMFCLEGSGYLSHMSLRHTMELNHRPTIFPGIFTDDGTKQVSKVLEGPVPEWKIFGPWNTGNGAAGVTFGMPRFESCSFEARFPFGTVSLADDEMPLAVSISGWSPFTPGNSFDSSLPVGALEYTFINTSDKKVNSVFSYNAANFMGIDYDHSRITARENGFVLAQQPTAEKPEQEGYISIFMDEPATVDHGWFPGVGWDPRLNWWDPMFVVWNNVKNGRMIDNPPQAGPVIGASLFVPFVLEPGESKTIKVLMAWYVPNTTQTQGNAVATDGPVLGGDAGGKCCPTGKCGANFYKPWYAEQFDSVEAVSKYWKSNYDRLKAESETFRDAFYDTTLPPEVIEAVAANLTILKSPTILRQHDGRIWGWEGCCEEAGCCAGSCTHVWNYAQSLAHLFPDLERGLRQTEFGESQNDEGHQTFRANLPISGTDHGFYAAVDGQLGGIMKMYREWRISGDSDDLRNIWPKIKASLDYCIRTWDPRHVGAVEEPHHNTYDIEFWGAEPLGTSFYAGALNAAIQMGAFLGEDVTLYRELLSKSIAYMERDLYDGEYFFQKVMTNGLNATFQPFEIDSAGFGYAAIAERVNADGPKYQYGTGCLSDGVLGFWMARVCGLDEVMDAGLVESHLTAVHKYNFKKDLFDHENPQRPTYAMGHEAGTLVCTWPKGGKPLLPITYGHEIWTGIEYQVASHLMMHGRVEEGLEIVRAVRDRYTGRVRNPFNEYECGNWYARAMSSYGLIQGMTGLRYDAVTKTLHIDSRLGGNFRAFLSTATGYGVAGLKDGQPFFEPKSGEVQIDRYQVGVGK